MYIHTNAQQCHANFILCAQVLSECVCGCSASNDCYWRGLGVLYSVALNVGYLVATSQPCSGGSYLTAMLWW